MSSFLIRRVVAILPMLLLSAAACAQAPAADDHAGHHAPGSSATNQAWIHGEVRRIDADANKLTLRHEAIPQFEMDAMTMAFRVARPALLEGIAVGDKVRFRLDKVGSRLTVVELQKLP